LLILLPSGPGLAVALALALVLAAVLGSLIEGKAGISSRMATPSSVVHLARARQARRLCWSQEKKAK
jgi:hypothetical protein